MDTRIAHSPDDTGPFRNRLAAAHSPYLAAHGADPVDWYPWGPAAFARARETGRPVFLSVGYAACHWCHVMHRESFADPATAAVLNRRVVSVKVDREEHPAVDRMAMDFLLEANGEAGWPATLFLDADGQPFEGGTYFPAWPRYGMPAFRTVVEGAADRFARGAPPVRRTPLPRETVADAADAVARLVAAQQPDGGWGGGPRFPHGPRLLLLCDAVAFDIPGAAAALRAALGAMVCGGLHDALAGGFHRYCVDADWDLPHFEKMLYDNALIASALLRADSRGAGPPGGRAAAGQALAWVERVLGRPDGALSGSQDADDPVGEGHAATWLPRELTASLGPELGRAVARAWQVGPSGPAEGRSLLRRRPGDAKARGLLSAARSRLMAARMARPQPPVHDQAVVAWNGLAVEALADLATLGGHPPAAPRAAAVADRLLRSRRAGRLPRTLAPGAPEGVLDDSAALLCGLLALHRATGAARWMAEALALAATIQDDFTTPAGQLRHTRTRGLLPETAVRAGCTAEPAGWGQALLGLQQLAALGWSGLDPRLLATLEGPGPHQDESASTLHRAALRAGHPHRSLVITGAPADPRTQALLRASWRPWRPGLTVLVVDPAQPGPLATLGATQGRLAPGPPRAWRCTGRACALPTSDPAAVARWVAAGLSDAAG